MLQFSAFLQLKPDQKRMVLDCLKAEFDLGEEANLTRAKSLFWDLPIWDLPILGPPHLGTYPFWDLPIFGTSHILGPPY